ncbi:periplasmic binding family protein [Escherichia coli 97.1742]|nr:periplasmic binding family protein [Escherichia coli 97.1742]
MFNVCRIDPHHFYSQRSQLVNLPLGITSTPGNHQIGFQRDNALRQLAPWSPQPDKAEQAAQSLLDQYAQLKAQYADKPKKRVFLQFGINPPFTSGKESIQNQVLEVCGGENIFKDSRVPWPQVSREQVLARSPQAIVITGGPDQIPKIKQYWGEQLKIPVIPLTSDWFERASPRIILAAQQLCNALSQVD